MLLLRDFHNSVHRFGEWGVLDQVFTQRFDFKDGEICPGTLDGDFSENKQVRGLRDAIKRGF